MQKLRRVQGEAPDFPSRVGNAFTLVVNNVTLWLAEERFAQIRFFCT
jgi:hypothetical protein